MSVKLLADLHLFTIREGAKGFIISLKASNRYAPKYLTNLEAALAMMADFAEEHDWPHVHKATTSHIEDYLLMLQTRRRWFGDRDPAQLGLSQSYIETQYRRLKRFFNWLISRGHIEINPLDLIPHPHVDERTISVVSEREMADILRLVDFRIARTAAERFRITRDRAVLYLLWDTPGRKTEIASLCVGDVDLDDWVVKVMGKGRRERWMPIGSVVADTLWEYLQARANLRPRSDNLWVNERGGTMRTDWLYLMLKRLGRRAGVANLHTHRFRHTWAMNMLRAGMHEQMMRHVAGWKRRVPDTYYRTLATEDVSKVHKQMSVGVQR